MKYLQARHQGALEQKIPRKIFITWDTLPPPEMEQKMMSWATLNPSYDFFFYDAADRLAFLKANFEPAVAAAYEELIPKAYKVDLWRYCMLLVEGGVYVDSKLEALVSLDTIIRDIDECIVPHDNDGMIAIGFLAFRRGHNLLREIISNIVFMVNRRDKSRHPLALTGPILFSVGFNKYYTITDRVPGQYDKYSILSYKNSQISSAAGVVLCNTTYVGYKEKSNPMWKHYPQLWVMNAVFRSMVSADILEFIERDIKDHEIIGVIRGTLAGH